MHTNKKLKRKRKLIAEQQRKIQYQMKCNRVYFVNNGTNIISTNYWDTPYGRKEYMYLSFVGDTFRLLVSDKILALLPYLKEEVCTISRGPLLGSDEITYEVKFGNNILFCVEPLQTDGTQNASVMQKFYKVSLWSKKCEKHLEKECLFQEVNVIPTTIDEDDVSEINLVSLEE